MHYTFQSLLYPLKYFTLVSKSHKITDSANNILKITNEWQRWDLKSYLNEFYSRANSITQNLLLVNSDHLIILKDVSPECDCNMIYHWILPHSSFYFYLIVFMIFLYFLWVSIGIAFSTSVLKPQHAIPPCFVQ